MVEVIRSGAFANALFSGAGRLCVYAQIRVGPPGIATNIVVSGPGPTNNLVV